MKGILKQLEVGVLLTDKTDPDYECYSQVYGGEYGFYDEDKMVYQKKDMIEAIRYAKEYVEDGVDMTYAIITNQGECCYTEPLDNSIIKIFTQEACDVEYSVAKINGTIIEGFLGNVQTLL